MPRAFSASARAWTWVDLPTPSPPSSVMNLPLGSRHADQRLQPKPDAAEKPASADVLAGDQRSDLRLIRVAGKNQQISDVIAFPDGGDQGPS